MAQVITTEGTHGDTIIMSISRDELTRLTSTLFAAADLVETSTSTDEQNIAETGIACNEWAHVFRRARDHKSPSGEERRDMNDHIYVEFNRRGDHSDSARFWKDSKGETRTFPTTLSALSAIERGRLAHNTYAVVRMGIDGTKHYLTEPS